MANIRNLISLTDHMTPTLRSVMKAMDSTLRVMKMIDKQSSAGIQSKAFKQAEKDIQRANNALIKMGNYAQMSNSKVQSSTEKSIRQMNALEAAAYGVSKAMSKIGQSSGITAKASGMKNFSPSAMFNNMQTRGTNMMNMSQMIGGTKSQAYIGAMMKSMGSLGSVATNIFSRIGSAASTAFSIAGNTVKGFTKTAYSAMDGLAKQSKIAWQGVASGIYTIKNVMSALSSLTNMTDSVISDMAKLDLFNYSGTSKSQAYGLAYEAAQNSRSDVSATSNLANRIAMSGVYGKQEGSLESSIKMAETINKALVVGGGTEQENQRAILQLSQGLSSGTLQGDELRSIREQSPYLADTLAQGLAKVDDSFIGTTAGDLKQLGADGKLTSDVVIKAFEAMEEQIDATFDEKAPKTWGQGVTSISNTIKFFMGILQDMEGGPLQKITELVWMISDYLQSDEGMQLLTGIAVVLGVIGNVLTFIVSSALNLISWLISNAWILIAVFLVLGAVALFAGIQALIAWIAAIWPLLLIIAIVAAVIAIVMSFGVTASEIVGAVAGGVMWFVGLLWNCVLAVIGFFKGLWNALGVILDNIGIGFNNMLLGVQVMWWDLLSTINQVIADVIKAVNKIPFIEIDASGFVNRADEYAKKAAEAEGKMQDYKSVGDAFKEGYDSAGAFQEGWSEEWFNSGYDWGVNLVDGMGDTAAGIGDMFDTSKMAEGLNVDAMAIDGGNLDSVDSIGSDVSISDEDVKLLRDMAARDYLLQLQTVTPVAHVTFGDVRETADVGKIVEVIEQMVDEQMATALVS